MILSCRLIDTMGNSPQSGTASTSETTKVNSQQNAQIYEQRLHLLSNVIQIGHLSFDYLSVLVMY